MIRATTTSPMVHLRFTYTKHCHVVFVSDNGGHLEDGANNVDLRDGKERMYEGGLRVPAFLYGLIKSKPNAVSSQMALTMDIYPTIAAIAGVTINHKIDGISILPVLRNAEQTLPQRPVFFTRREGNMRFAGQTIQAVINGNMKLLQNSPYEPCELYDLYHDPTEQRNLVSYNVDAYKNLLGLLIKQMKKGGSVPW